MIALSALIPLAWFNDGVGSNHTLTPGSEIRKKSGDHAFSPAGLESVG
jgi:hypothetical protein